MKLHYILLESSLHIISFAALLLTKNINLTLKLTFQSSSMMQTWIRLCGDFFHREKTFCIQLNTSDVYESAKLLFEAKPVSVQLNTIVVAWTWSMKSTCKLNLPAILVSSSPQTPLSNNPGTYLTTNWEGGEGGNLSSLSGWVSLCPVDCSKQALPVFTFSPTLSVEGTVSLIMIYKGFSKTP